jgi:arylsulfatase
MRFTTWLGVATASALLVAAACSSSQAPPPEKPAAGPAAMDRTVLPIPEPSRPAGTEIDARNVTPPPRFEVKAPRSAPNVVIVLIDDMGFGVPSAFGGPVPMPTIERLSQNGIRYNNFHTTALCSPTRAARSPAGTITP